MHGRGLSDIEWESEELDNMDEVEDDDKDINIDDELNRQ